MPAKPCERHMYHFSFPSGRFEYLKVIVSYSVTLNAHNVYYNLSIYAVSQ